MDCSEIAGRTSRSLFCNSVVLSAVQTLLFTTVDLLRSELAKIGPFWWMLWNLALALIPVGLAMLFLKRSEQPKKGIRTVVFFLQLGLILLFLPNAPYVATDLIHFLDKVRVSDISLWHLMATEFPLYVGFVLLGLTSYSFTIDRILFALRKRFGRTAYWSGLVLLPILNAIGVYLGRVARFNSWDILQSPLNIARSGRTAMLDSRMLRIILGMSILLFVVHQFYSILHDGIRHRRAAMKSRRDARTRLLKRETELDVSREGSSA